MRIWQLQWAHLKFHILAEISGQNQVQVVRYESTCAYTTASFHREQTGSVTGPAPDRPADVCDSLILESEPLFTFVVSRCFWCRTC